MFDLISVLVGVLIGMGLTALCVGIGFLTYWMSKWNSCIKETKLEG